MYRNKSLLILFIAVLAIFAFIVNELVKKNNQQTALIEAMRGLLGARSSAQVKTVLVRMASATHRNRPLFKISRGQADEVCTNIEELWYGIDEDTELSANDLIDLADDMFVYGAQCMGLTLAQ